MFVIIVPNLLSWGFFIKSADESNANKERHGVSLGWHVVLDAVKQLTLLQSRLKQKRQRCEAERPALPSCIILEVDAN